MPERRRILVLTGSRPAERWRSYTPPHTGSSGETPSQTSLQESCTLIGQLLAQRRLPLAIRQEGSLPLRPPGAYGDE